MKKRRGHYCWACGRTRPNEKFSGRGHRDHICKECQAARKRERRAAQVRTAEPGGTRGGPEGGRIKGAVGTCAFDLPSIRREIDYAVSRARAGDSRLVTFGPLLFFSTSTGDAWMLDPEDGSAACLARDGVRESVEIEDKGSSLAIRWPSSYPIDGEAFVFMDRSTGRMGSVLGYPVHELSASTRTAR